MSEETKGPTTAATTGVAQSGPDDREPSPEQQAELRAAYEAKVAAGKALYADVLIKTLGELRWVMRERPADESESSTQGSRKLGHMEPSSCRGGSMLAKCSILVHERCGM